MRFKIIEDDSEYKFNRTFFVGSVIGIIYGAIVLLYAVYSHTQGQPVPMCLVN